MQLSDILENFAKSIRDYEQVLKEELRQYLDDATIETIMTNVSKRCTGQCDKQNNVPLNSETDKPAPQSTTGIRPELNDKKKLVEKIKTAKKEGKYLCVDSFRNITKNAKNEKTYYFYPTICIAGKPRSPNLEALLTMFKKTDLVPENIDNFKPVKASSPEETKPEIQLSPAKPVTHELVLTKNSQGNMEEATTHIVFDDKKCAIGVQNADKVEPLDALHIATCEKNGWAYECTRDACTRDECTGDAITQFEDALKRIKN